ncbi:MAG: threonine/serine exporter family protein [Oscillospiraceae bacterium]
MPNFLLSCLYSLLGGIGYTLVCNLRGRLLIISSIGGPIGLSVFYLCGLFGNDILQSFFATVVISIYSEIMSRLCKTPVTVFLIVGILPLVPGGGLYYTMEYCINGNIPMFIQEGLHTFFIAGAIAVGIILISSIVRLIYRVKASFIHNARL